jgi:hypothetical protein
MVYAQLFGDRIVGFSKEISVKVTRRESIYTRRDLPCGKPIFYFVNEIENLLPLGHLHVCED